MNNLPDITLLLEKELPDPEARAMLGGFYSRSCKPIKERLNELKDESLDGIKKSLQKYAIGYGHKSLLDLATTPLIFLEGVSILATKSIEMTPLGNFQETSTRYIDFSQQPFFNPINQEDTENYNTAQKIITDWIDYYNWLTGVLRVSLTDKYPINANETVTVYNKAINAKVFDIARSLLPTAMKTQVAMSMTCSSFKEHIIKLLYHPLPEVQTIALLVYSKIQQEYPFSFIPLQEIKDTYSDNSDIIQNEFYCTTPQYNAILYRHITVDSDNILFNLPLLSLEEKNIISNFKYSFNPKKRIVQCPACLNKLGTISIKFSLDYGSWRDLQRHRNTLYNKCTILTGPSLNFSWDYFEESNVLNEEVKLRLDEFIFKQFVAIDKLKETACLSKEEYQYFYPLGTLVNAELVCSLPELIYIMELRSTRSVHFTLRSLIHAIYDKLPPNIKEFMVVDKSVSDFYVERGHHDIIKLGD